MAILRHSRIALTMEICTPAHELPLRPALLYFAAVRGIQKGRSQDRNRPLSWPRSEGLEPQPSHRSVEIYSRTLYLPAPLLTC
jgi:hypothetical protein